MHHRIKLSAIVGVIAAIGALGSIWPGVSTASTPGVDWTAHPTPSKVWNGVAYGNGIWVAVGDAGAVMTSTDASTWTLVPNAPSGNWKDIAYADGKFVAVAADYATTNAVIMTSTNGTAWTTTTVVLTAITGSFRAALQGVAFGNGVWVVAVANAQSQSPFNWVTLTSTDGSTWTERVNTSSKYFRPRSVAYGDGTFVLVSNTGNGGDPDVKVGTDGLTWTEKTSPVAGTEWGDVAYGNGVFVAVGGSRNTMWSADKGQTWTTSTPAAANGWRSVAYGAGTFVAVANSGTGNRVMTSPDGKTWTAQKSAADNDWLGVGAGDDQFVAVANVFPTGTDGAMTSGPPPRDLTVTRAGDGAGSVTSSPAGIDCGSTCTASFANGTSITLTAAPAAGSSFTGWSDGCSGTATTCTVTISAATTVTATFTKDAATPTAATTPAEKASTPLTIARASGNASIITTTVKATTAGRAVMTGTVGGKAAFKPGTHVFTKPSTATIRATLNDRVRALLRTRDVRVRITVRFTAADGRTTTSTRTVLLKKIHVRPEPVTG